MAVITKKISKEYFDLIASGKKKFEFRLADFDMHEGDTLILEEWEGHTSSRVPTGRKIEKKVFYLWKSELDSFGQMEAIKEKGFYVIQFE